MLNLERVDTLTWTTFGDGENTFWSGPGSLDYSIMFNFKAPHDLLKGQGVACNMKRALED